MTTIPSDTATDIADTSWLRDITVVQVVGVVVVLLVLWVTVRKIIKALKPARDFLHDWNGEAARPGVPEVPGMMMRFARMESFVRESVTRKEFETLASKVDHNGPIIESHTSAIARLESAIENGMTTGKE